MNVCFSWRQRAVYLAFIEGPSLPR